MQLWPVQLWPIIGKTSSVVLVDDGLLLEDAERFDDLIERCASIAERAKLAANNQHIRT